MPRGLSDISKILHHAGPQKLDWSNLTDHTSLLSFFEKIKEKGIGPKGRLTKVSDALKYLKFGLNASQMNKDTVSMLSRIKAVEESLAQWKTVLCRDKKRLAAIRLEKASNELPPLESVNAIVESEELGKMFRKVVKRRIDGIPEELRFAVAAICIPLMLTSSSRPGAIINCTQKKRSMKKEGWWMGYTCTVKNVVF